MQYSSNSGSSWTTFSDGTSASTSATVTGLTLNTAYIFRVAAVNALGAGSYSDPSASFTPVAHDSGALIPLQVITVSGSGASSVSFTNIPNTYSHLQIRGFGRTDRAGINSDVIRIRFNGDTASNYSVHSLLGEGTGTAEAFANTTQTYMQTYIVAAAGAGANTFGTFITDILDYTSTNKNKTIRQLAGIDNNGNGVVSLFSGLWYKTPEAINTITMTAIGSFLQYSQFALYAVKGA